MKRKKTDGEPSAVLTPEDKFLQRLKLAHETGKTIKYFSKDDGMINVIVAEEPMSLDIAIELSPVGNPSLFHMTKDPMNTISGLPRLPSVTQNAPAAI